MMTIKGAADASGLSTDTIRYYERTGVLPPASRTMNGYRRYTDPHIETLRFARSLRDLGLPVGRMTNLIRVFHDGTCRDMRDALVACAHEALARVVTQRQDLERAERQLRAVLDEVESIAANEQPRSGLSPCACVVAVEHKAACSARQSRRTQ